MMLNLSRRKFLAGTLGSAAAGGLGFVMNPVAVANQEPPKAPDHTLTVISGTPRDRGRQYGRKFEEGIRAFLDKEIYKPFAATTQTRDDLLRYAGSCAKATRSYSPEIADELEGMAEGTGLWLEETRDMASGWTLDLVVDTAWGTLHPR